MKSRKQYNDLQPSKSKTKGLGKFITIDIESNNWRDFVVGGIFNGTDFTYYKTCASLCEAIDRHENHKVFAHFGGIFDFLFLLDHYGINRNIKGDMLMRGSSVFGFTVNTNSFYDSSGILPFSLDRAAKSFGVSHQKLEIDHSKIKMLTPELLKYLKHDCVALYESIQKFYDQPILEHANFKPTLASQSIEVLRNFITTSIPSINSKSVDDFVRLGYAGGRVEIFRPYYKDKKPLYYYDFSSLYPSVMKDMNVPGRMIKVAKDYDELSFTDCEIETPKDIYLPVLWKKQANKFYFPRGRFRGVFPGCEIIEAVKRGYTIHKIYKSMHFENLGRVFYDYVETLYSQKEKSHDEVSRMVAKLLLNAGYGRLAIKRERESLCFDDGSNGITPLNLYIGEHRLAKKETFYKGFSNAAIGAIITARARLKLYNTMQPIQDYIYYCDTDSIITTKELQVGVNIGDLKLEDKAHEACFLLPKTYIFNKSVKMKGFPKEFAQSLDFQDFRNAMEGDLRAFKTPMPGKLARIKSARNNGKSVLKLLQGSHRQLKSKYDKREIFLENNTFNTRPIEL